MSNELATCPVYYEPSMGDNREYVDKVPSSALLAKGIRCACSTRQTVFTTRPALVTHFKTLVHQAWVQTQNRNQENHFAEVLQLRESVKQQSVLIAERDQKILKLEKNLREKEMVIRTLSSMLSNAPAPVSDTTNTTFLVGSLGHIDL